MNKLLDKKIIALYVVIELIIFGVIKYLEITSQFNFKMCVAKYMAIVVDFIVATCGLHYTVDYPHHAYDKKN